MYHIENNIHSDGALKAVQCNESHMLFLSFILVYSTYVTAICSLLPLSPWRLWKQKLLTW